MSMLSGPRKKARYSTNPNGNLWADDENGFGRQMLERLGWTPGSGLGKQKNGISKALKPNGQKGREGLGRKLDYQLGGTKQLDDYAQLLKELNSSYESKRQQSSSTSLEKASKTSTNRLHYAKLVRAKDASQYDEKSLAIILGQKPADSGTVEEASSKRWDTSTDFGIKTVTSALTMNDYFKKRRDEVRRAQSIQSSPAFPAVETDPCTSDQTMKKRKRKDLNTISLDVGCDKDSDELVSQSVCTENLSTPQEDADCTQEGLPNSNDNHQSSRSDSCESTSKRNIPTSIPESCAFWSTNLLSISGYKHY